MSTRWIVTVLMATGSLIFTPLASAGPEVMCPVGRRITSPPMPWCAGMKLRRRLCSVHKASLRSSAWRRCTAPSMMPFRGGDQHRFEPYAIDIASGAGSSSAAVAKAARDVLVAVISAQTAAIDTRYTNFLTLNGLMGNVGIGTGAEAAAAMIALRATDGSFPSPAPTFFGGTGPGQWRSTATPAASMAAPWLADVTPFTLNSQAQLRPHGPPHLESGLYARDYQEVKDYGGNDPSTTLRTQEQTDLAIFYSDNFIMLWQRTLRGVATTYIGNLGDSARMFALANLSAAHAAIGGGMPSCITTSGGRSRPSVTPPRTAMPRPSQIRLGRPSLRRYAELPRLHVRRKQPHGLDGQLAVEFLRAG